MTKRNLGDLLKFYFIIFILGFATIFLFTVVDESFSQSTWVSDGNYATEEMSGDGTSTNPFIIEDEKDLARISYYVNKGDAKYKLKYFKLNKNLNLFENNWVPIGTKTNPFSGNFNGNRFGIANMNIIASSDYCGLFGYSTGDISNLIVSGKISAGSYSNIGGIVGYTTSNLSNVSSGVTIVGKNYVGGIAGVCTKAISNSYNTGNISGATYVAGISGNCANITKSYNSGTINSSDSYVAGIVAEGEKLTFCYNYGTVEGKKSWVGGLMAFSDLAKISECFNTGYIKGQSEVAGIIAWTSGATLYSSISNSSNSGTIEGNECVGGICDLGYGSFTNCYNVGTIKSSGNVAGGIVAEHCGKIENCYNSGVVYGNQIVGGIAGRSYNNKKNTSTANQYIKNCKNVGSIYGESKVAGIVGSADYMGVVGCCNLATIANNPSISDRYCTYIAGIVGYRNNLGTTSYCYNTGAIKVNSNGGGIVGYQDHDDASIYKCYNTGSIYNDDVKNFVGAICGRNKSNKGTCKDNYYLSKCCSPNYAFGTSGGGGTDSSGGKSYEKSYSELTNSSFASTLSSDYFSSVSSSYPTLKNVENSFVNSLTVYFTSANGWTKNVNLNSYYPYLDDLYWK